MCILGVRVWHLSVQIWCFGCVFAHGRCEFSIHDDEFENWGVYLVLEGVYLVLEGVNVVFMMMSLNFGVCI